LYSLAFVVWEDGRDIEPQTKKARDKKKEEKTVSM